MNIGYLAGAVLLVGGGALTLAALPRESQIGGFSTSLDGRTRSQRHNARLAVVRLNGATVQPGEVFSFNQRVGTFSEDQGYRKAPVSYNGQLISDWGGGVCQTSTTLYNAALLAGMQVVERNRHHFMPSYVPPGRDAAVAFSSIDLKLKNTSDSPIRIEAQIAGDSIRVNLLAPKPLKTRPEITQVVRDTIAPSTFILGNRTSAGHVRNSGKMGFDVTVYRQTGPIRERISTNTYPAMNRVVEYR